RELLLRSRQVVRRQQPERDDVDADLVAPAQELLDLVGAGLVPVGGARAGLASPPTVSVEDDADVTGDAVEWQRRGEPAFVRAVQHVGQTHATPVPRLDPASVPPGGRPTRDLERLRSRNLRFRRLGCPMEAERASDQSLDRVADAVDERLGQVVERAAAHVPATVKPRLRGWLHAGAVPVVAAAGLLLVAVSRGTDE